VHTFCRRRKSTAERLGRSPGSEVQSVLCGCFTFPGLWPSGRSKQRPHSQWRDRAGFTPDFPVMPIVGTQTRSGLYHDRLDTANLWTHRMRSSRVWDSSDRVLTQSQFDLADLRVSGNILRAPDHPLTACLERARVSKTPSKKIVRRSLRRLQSAKRLVSTPHSPRRFVRHGDLVRP
jgi:hypothetical protein